MDALPPNDPNNNNNNNNTNNTGAGKNVQSERGDRNGRQSNGDGPQLNENGEMSMFGGGNLGDDVMLGAMVMMGVAAYLLREICVC